MGYRHTRRPSTVFAAQKMKIAVCFSGLSKCYEQAVESVKQNFFDKCDCDLFAHTWDTPSVINYSSSKEQFFEKTFKRYEIEHFDINASWNTLTQEQQLNMPKPCRNVVPMFYSIYKANCLKSQQENQHSFAYDIVVRSRLDSLYESFLPESELEILKVFKHSLFCGWHGMDDNAKSIRNYFQYDESAAPFVADNFAFSTSKTMDVYSSTYLHLANFKELYKKTGTDVSGTIPGPEISLGTHLLKNRINFFRTCYKFKSLTSWSKTDLHFTSYYNSTSVTTLPI